MLTRAIAYARRVFGLGRKGKIRRAVDRALATVRDERDFADVAAIEALPAEWHAQAFGWLAVALFDDERYAAAKVLLDRALALAPDEPQLHELAGAIATELGDADAAIEAQRRVVAASPRDPKAAIALAELLIAAERPGEAITLLEPLLDLHDPEVETRLAEALFVSDRAEEALALLDGVCELYDAQLQQLSPADWQALKARADEAMRLRDDVYAELHGREATIELAAAAGKLDARAGVNYRLLGAQLAVKSQRIAEVLELEDPDATERRGRAMLERTARSGHGHALVGIAQLRRGEVSAARTSFERACEADGSCFAAFLGLGAVMDHDTHDLHRRAARFATPPVSGEIAAALVEVVPDWRALTAAEQRVVWASAQPLGRLLPVLAERGVEMRILPIDVRATDVELFAEVAGVRESDDQRSYDAITGVATHGGAIAKIEELLDVVGDGGWTFAHELSHLAFFHMEEQDAQPLLAIYERALSVGYANIEYALSNPDEFFAVSYVEFLRRRYELPGVPEDDDAGIHQDLTSYFDQLARH